MKATINLKIYDENDAVIAEFETSRVRWGYLHDVIELSEKIKGQGNIEQFDSMGKMVQLLFPNLTDELLRQADFIDVKNCFEQIKNIAKQIEVADSKNV